MEKEKRRRGRPSGAPAHAFNFRMEMDVYEWVCQNKPENVSMTKFINSMLRKIAKK